MFEHKAPTFLGRTLPLLSNVNGMGSVYIHTYIVNCELGGPCMKVLMATGLNGVHYLRRELCACVCVRTTWPSVCACAHVHLYTRVNVIIMLRYIENLPVCITNA